MEQTNQILFLCFTLILYLLFYFVITKLENIKFQVFIAFIFSLLITLLASFIRNSCGEDYVENNVGPSASASACTLSEYNTLKNYDKNRTFGVPNLNFGIDGRLCQGGPYTWQGSSKRAVACRQLASTPEGMDEIQRYNCGTGYSGLPGKGFKFTPIGEQCNEQINTDIRDNGIF
jgi:hypothetical protein